MRVTQCDAPAASSGNDFNATATSDRVRLAGAINETLSFTFAITIGNDTVAAPQLRATALKGTNGEIDAGAVEFFRMEQVLTPPLPGWHIREIAPIDRVDAPLDVLVPIGSSDEAWPPQAHGKTHHYWVDVRIPKETSDGIFAGEVQLTSNGKTLAALSVELTVWPFMLPDESNVSMIAEVDDRVFRKRSESQANSAWSSGAAPRGSEGRFDSRLAAVMRLLKEHRLTPVLPRVSPEVHIASAGNIQIDWTSYDREVEPFLSGEAFAEHRPLRFWPIPIDTLTDSISSSNAPLSSRFREEYLADCAAHFRQKGWLDRGYLMLVGTCTAPESTRGAMSMAQIARTADRGLRVATQCFPQDMRGFGWSGYQRNELADYVQIWAPRAQFYDPQAMGAERAKGRTTWVTIDRPPFSGSTSIFAPETYSRVLSWHLDALGAGAAYLGMVNSWPAGERSEARACIEREAKTLVYPGEPYGVFESIPSVRLKHLRRTMQDAAYVQLLREHKLDHVADVIRDSLSPYAGADAYHTHFADGKRVGWSDDPEVFEDARRLMAEELCRSASGDEGDEQADFGRGAKWRRFLLATRRLEAGFEGARVRVDRRGESTFTVNSSWTLRNRTRSDLDASISLKPRPESWSTPPNNANRDRLVLAAGEPRRISFEHIVPASALAMGKTMLPIEVSAPPEVEARTQGVLSIVTASAYAGGIAVDGDLSDWPPGAGNVLSDFRLISGADGSHESSGKDLPRARTTGFVLRDASNLYIAINCEVEPEFDRTPSSRKGITYDDLIPLGEELAEVLIDPLNAGTRSPSDLFHIVVKRSGADLLEKGIGTTPPCGTCTPWAAKVEIATKVTPQRWTAEIRIPLIDLTPPPHSDTVWGFNVTRFHAARQEFSTWSGAVRSAYDPLALGNLYIP